MVEQKNEEDVLGRHDQGEGKESRQQGTTHDQMTREDRHRDEELQGDYIPNKGEEWDDLESFEEQMRREAEDKVDNELELQQLREEAELSVEELIERHKLLDRHKLLEQAQSCEDESLHQHKERPAAHVQPQTAFQIPSILKHELRDYQKFGLQWLLGCHRTGVNGILADEMGLGKTIQTISLLAHLACEQGVWGPHLIIVPTSVMVNWEVEFKKWCPALKIITYFGSQKERKMQRMGWSKPNSFHVCITTYRLVVQDQTIFRRKRWHYLILDEAHMIKNWRSQRWQTILTFESAHRLLITGTPLQNDVMELWALLHFLMPDLFQSHSEFKSWFSNPLLGMAEGKIAIDHGLTSRLHSVLRPFILRRLKIDVETSLPSKIEHVVRCRLSRRQKRLYDEYMSSNDTVKILGSSNVMGVMNCLMQLRKVCNHPDLFAGRSIISAYDMPCEIFMKFPGSCTKILRSDHLLRPVYPVSSVDRRLTHVDILSCGTLGADEFVTKQLRQVRIMQLQQKYCRNPSTASQLFHVSSSRFHATETVAMSVSDKVTQANHHTLLEFEQVVKMDQVLKFRFRIPKVRARTPIGCVVHNRTWNENVTFFNQLLKPLRDLVIRGHIVFPDARLVQFDCGKLQALAPLLRVLKSGGHKVVIFTQMTKVLDILERFLNLYSYSYVRLDGTTKPEQRQILMQRFNADQRLFAFILSTRSGGFGINLTGADTVIFYDSDWNPAVDAQAQDRCHRIGQTREVNIYRLISENTVEENVFKKALQKRELDELAIQKGHFNLNALEGMYLYHFLLFTFSTTFLGIELDEKTDAPNDKVRKVSNHVLF